MEQLKVENVQLKGKSDESMMRAMSMMMGGQASLVIKQTFVGWRDLLHLFRQERMREELLRFKWKSDESLKQAMTAMLGGQSNLLLKNLVSSWRDELVSLR